MGAPAQDRDAPPGRVGRYQIVRRIPGGGMTEVYLARVADARGPERLLVLKVLPEGPERRRDGEVRFLEEAKIALSLSHGNVVTTFETGRAADGRPFLVMEYVHGASLRDLLAGGGVPAPLSLLVVREVARALRYTHTFVDIEGRASPIVHLDVTPENVLVSRAGHVKLTDFGIARAVGEAVGGPIFGKPAYAAPEVLEGASGGPASDLWSLGCVLYELLSGRAPHRGEDREETLANVRAGELPPAPSAAAGLGPDVADAIDGLLADLLARDPDARLADAAVVERVLSTALTRIDPLPTEADLAALMAARLPAAGAGERDRLRAELQAAGRDVSGAEDTAALLAEGTVPLGEGAPPVAPAPGGPPKRRRAGWMAAVGIVVAVPILWLALPRDGDGPPDEPALTAETSMVDPAPAGVVPPVPDPVEPPGAAGPEAAEEDVAIGEGSSTGASPAPTEPAAPRVATVPSAGSAPGDGERPRAVASAAEQETTPEPPPPAPAEDAVVQINAFPYAQVRVGETALGTTPLRDVALPAGRHRFVFENPELGLEREVVVDLEPGERRVVGVRLDR